MVAGGSDMRLSGYKWENYSSSQMQQKMWNCVVRVSFDEGGAHAEEPDEEQLRTLWCGGLNEKVTEEVNTFFDGFTHLMPSFRFCMSCSWMLGRWKEWPYQRTGRPNSRKTLDSSSLSTRRASSLPTIFSMGWSCTGARSDCKTRPRDLVSFVFGRVWESWHMYYIQQASTVGEGGVTVLATTAPTPPRAHLLRDHLGLLVHCRMRMQANF